ncbi:vWA domain-containing protein [Pyxidicoccus sp. 3LFB2]
MLKRFPRALLLLAALTLLTPLASRAAGFTVPNTGAANPPVGQVRIYVEFASPPTPGAGVGATLNGTPIPLTEPTAPDPQTVGGDEAFFIRRETTGALLIVDTFSLLASNTNYCQKSATTPGEKAYTLEFTGLPTVTRFAMTGLSATRIISSGGGPAETIENCKCPSRRVEGLTWSTPPAGADMGRLPLDIVLVLDQSGSMGSFVTGGTTVRRIDAMRAAVGEFIAAWELEGAGTTTNPSLGLARDRLGVVYFSSTAPVPPAPAEPFLVERGTAPAGTTHAWQAFLTNVLMREPDNLTAMGQGLLHGYTALDARPAASKLDRTATMVVMTDGMQNVDPRVRLDAVPGESVQRLFLNMTGGAKTLASQCTPILGVSVGEVTSPWVETMRRISMETAGEHLLSKPNTMMDDFATQLVNALKGNTLSVLMKDSGSALFGQATTRTVFLDGTVEFAIINLGWLGASPQVYAQLRLTSPDGTVVQPVARVDGPTFTTQRVDLPKSGKPGMWKLEVIPSSVIGINKSAAAAVGQMPFQLRVIAEEKSLAYQFGVEGTRHPVGAPLKVFANLTWDGKPLKDLNGELRVRYERPAAALGTLLHEAKTPDSQLPQLGEPRLAYQAKVDGLLQNPDYRGRMGQRPQDPDEPALLMKHEGEGRYSLEFPNTPVPGTYRFFVQLEMKSPKGEPVRRLEQVEAIVEAIPNGTLSEVKSTATGENSFTLTFLPRDDKGHFLGPGYDDFITVRIDGKGTLKAVANPDVRGAYQVELTDIDKSTPVVLAVAGTPIAQGPVAEPKPMKPGDKVLPLPGSEPGPKPGDGCGCRRTPSGGMLGLMGLAVLGFIARRRGRRDDE